MEREIEQYLRGEGITTGTIDLLVSEEISNVKTFLSLKEEHFMRMLKRKVISIGQHCLLWESWRQYTESYEDEPILNRNTNNSTCHSDLRKRPSPSHLPSPHSTTITTSSHELSQPSSIADRKELFEKYKSQMKEKGTDPGDSDSKSLKGPKPAAEKRISVHVGAMIYDNNLRKGVMKKHLPGPRIIDFVSTTQYGDLIARLQPMFFSGECIAHGQFAISNSSGIPYDIDSDNWQFHDFVKTHGPPSKLRIYLLYFPNVAVEKDVIEITEESSPQISNPTRDIKPEKYICIECRRLFIAPVQNASCEMPDGSYVYRKDYIDKCPICDEDCFGITWNLYFMEDLEDDRSFHPDVKPYIVDF